MIRTVIDPIVTVELAVAVRSPGSYIFVDWSEEDAEVIDIPPARQDFETDEDTDHGWQHTMVGIGAARRPARANR
jgi:hypothetical protein